MPGPDYLQFKQTYKDSLMHSPKGTTWKNHKYIRKEEKRYIYKQLQSKIHLAARNLRDNVKESEDSIKELLREAKKPIEKNSMEIGEKAIKSVFSKDWLLKSYEISSGVVDEGWKLLDWILKEKR